MNYNIIRAVLVAFLLCFHSFGVCWAENEKSEVSLQKQESIRLFLQKRDKRSASYFGKSTLFAISNIPHNNIYVVYITGQAYCGSGGCTLIFLKDSGNSYKEIGNIPAVWLPIVALRTQSEGVPDIGVWIHGGGIIQPYQAVVSFKGGRYRGKVPLSTTKRVEAGEGEALLSKDSPQIAVWPGTN